MGIADSSVEQSRPGIYHVLKQSASDLIPEEHNPLEYAISLNSTFQNVPFPEGYELTLDVPNVKDFSSLCNKATGIKKVTLKGNVNGDNLLFPYAFNQSTIEVLDLTNLIFTPENIEYFFYEATALREVKGVIITSYLKNGYRALHYCYALEEVRFVPNSLTGTFDIPHSPLLSAETRQSIVDALQKTEEDGYQLMLHSDVTAAFTEKQLQQILEKGWTVI